MTLLGSLKDQETHTPGNCDELSEDQAPPQSLPPWWHGEAMEFHHIRNLREHIQQARHTLARYTAGSLAIGGIGLYGILAIEPIENINGYTTFSPFMAMASVTLITGLILLNAAWERRSHVLEKQSILWNTLVDAIASRTVDTQALPTTPLGESKHERSLRQEAALVATYVNAEGQWMPHITTCLGLCFRLVPATKR